MDQYYTALVRYWWSSGSSAPWSRRRARCWAEPRELPSATLWSRHWLRSGHDGVAHDGLEVRDSLPRAVGGSKVGPEEDQLLVKTGHAGLGTVV